MLAYLTDIEGQWEKLTSFVEDSPCVSLAPDGALVVAPGATFVFGGDAIDRGPAARRIVRALLAAKARQPDQVVLLAGNRDINKMRLVRELAGAPPKKTPPEMRDAAPAALLPWIFANTMGARDAFEHRRAELAREGRAHSDEAAVQSFLDDLAPDGDLARYLAAAQLAWLGDGTLAVHGAVTDESLGVVPARPDRYGTVTSWVAGLNEFYAAEVGAWRASRGLDPTAGQALIAYQAPLGDTKANQASVVYGRPTDDANNPRLPSRAVVEALRRDGVKRLLVGHTPTGDVPAALTDEGFAMVMADNSYGRVEAGSRVHVEGDVLSVRGATQLDDGTRVGVDYALGARADDPLLGRRDRETGQLVKARLASGDYLVFRALPNNQVEQRAVSAVALRARPLGPYYAGAADEV